ncbi:MAG: DUF3592 domain-containing protein [Chitinophagia bacterium]|nr:DUF3592 domain-containing protein [Chitinophagia bacterium]
MEEGMVVGVLVCSIAPILVALRVRRYRKAMAKAAYPTVSGTICKNVLDVKEHESTDSDNRREVSYEYIPRVEYTFSVGGKTYTGRRINVLGSKSSSLESEALKVLAAYPLNATVDVYHNPDDPEDAFLENDPGKRMIDGNTWFAAIILLVIGIAMMVFV